MGKLIRLWLLLAVLNVVLSQDTAIKKYFTDGSKLTMNARPPSSSDRITDILWKFNNNLLAEWVENVVPLNYYSTFKTRTTLDTTTGRLEIDQMTRADQGVYSVELNGKLLNDGYVAIPIRVVSEPEVLVRTLTCTEKSERCNVTCTVDTTEAEPITYSWKMGDGEWTVLAKDVTITKRDHAGVKTITCRVTNPVSEKTSKSIQNPLYVENVIPIAVGVSLAVIGLVLVIVGLLVAAWKYKKGPFKNRDNAGATETAPNHTDPVPSPKKSELLPLNDKPEDGGEDV